MLKTAVLFYRENLVSLSKLRSLSEFFFFEPGKNEIYKKNHEILIENKLRLNNSQNNKIQFKKLRNKKNILKFKHFDVGFNK